MRVTDWELNEHRYRPLLDTSEPRLLGATSWEEQAFCQWYATHGLSGRGVVVELGPWLGSLTIPTARGLAANVEIPRPGRTIHSFDLFLWNLGFEGWVAGTQYEGRYKPGDTFLPLYEELVAPYGNDVTVIAHQEDLAVARWADGPIEILINDAWKLIPIMTNVIERFLPALAPGAILFHQDYLWTSESFIHVAMYRLRDCFRFVCRIENSSTVLFRKVREIPEAVLTEMAALSSYSSFDEAEIHAAFDWSKALFVDPEARLVVDAGRAWMLARMGNTDAARRIFAGIKHSPHYRSPFYQHQEGLLRQWGLDALIG